MASALLAAPIAVFLVVMGALTLHETVGDHRRGLGVEWPNAVCGLVAVLYGVVTLVVAVADLHAAL